ncbi:MAG: DUF6090 family protein [Melioribacteraceae bacterium]
MIKFFRKIRKSLLSEGKTGKYFKYAIGEILLVVIGILIALQLNNWNDNNNKIKIGKRYLIEMKSELQDDALKLDGRIIRLKNDLENQETALNTKDITKLPLDSLKMILISTNLDFKISDLTYNKMNNIGLTALSNNDSLNSKIFEYYNRNVESLKLSMRYIHNAFIKRGNFYHYEQDEIDFSTVEYSREFPSLYKESEKESEIAIKSNIVKYIYSIEGRNIIIDDLNGKRYSLRVLRGFQEKTRSLLKTIYDELKVYDPHIEPLQTLHSEIKEITLSQDILKNYIGTYKGENDDLIVLMDDMRIYFELPDGSKDEVFPYEEDKFFLKKYIVKIQFNKEKDEIKSLTVNGTEEYIKHSIHNK